MLHEVGLSDYEASVIGERYLMLGTRGSYGIERLHVTADESWRTLAITVTFCPPSEPPVRMLLGNDGCIDVPPEATAKATSIAAELCFPVLMMVCAESAWMFLIMSEIIPKQMGKKAKASRRA